MGFCYDMATDKHSNICTEEKFDIYASLLPIVKFPFSKAVKLGVREDLKRNVLYLYICVSSFKLKLVFAFASLTGTSLLRNVKVTS